MFQSSRHFQLALIAIFGILMVSLALPLLRNRICTQPIIKIDLESVQAAWLQYKAEYGISNKLSAEFTLRNRDLVAILTGSQEGIKQNPKRIEFLSISTNRLIEDRFVDPWGQPYYIAFLSNAMTIPNTSARSGFAVWSSGPNRQNEVGQNDDYLLWLE